MTSLRERYFGSKIEQDEELQRLSAERVHRLSAGARLIDSCSDLRSWLEAQLGQREPTGPMDHATMLFRDGTRNGLMLVKRYLLDLEREIKESRNV